MRREAIDKFLDSKLSKDEMEDIFIPETRRVCQTCHKVRLRKKLIEVTFHQNIEGLYALVFIIIKIIIINQTKLII